MEKIIALDIGNVCLRIHYERAFAALGYNSTQEIPEEFMLATDKMERGLLSEKDWLKTFNKITEERFTDDQLIDAWNLILGEDIECTKRFVRDFSQRGYRFIFFSDTSESHIAHVYRTLSFVHLVTGKIFSHEVGAKKPEDAMYGAFEKEYGVPCLYIDDLPRNIEAGKKRGWNSILFTGEEDLKKAASALN